MIHSVCVVCGIPILKKKYCSHKCRNLGEGNFLRSFSKNRIGRTYEDIFGIEKSKIIKKKISVATRTYSLKMGRVPPSRKGIKDSELTRFRKSMGHKGINTWMRGRKIPKKSILKMIETRRKNNPIKKTNKICLYCNNLFGSTGLNKKIKCCSISCAGKLRWQNKEFREKILPKIIKGAHIRPTSLEKQMLEIIEKNNLPYKYTGNGDFWIGGKNPDFVNINGEKKLIEVGNVYHHQGDYIEKRREHFAKYGWKSFIFIEDKLNEERILKEIFYDT